MTGLEVFPWHLVSSSRDSRKYWPGDFVGQLEKKELASEHSTQRDHEDVFSVLKLIFVHYT